MMNFLMRFQNRVTDLPPAILLTLAIVILAAGVFVFLGGLGFKRIMFVAIGAFFGAFSSLFYAETNPLLDAALIGIFSLLAFKLQDTFLVLVASAFAAVIGYSLLIRPYYRPSNNILAVIRQITIGVPYYNWPILLAVTAAPFALISWQGASAFFTSTAGAFFIFAGAIMISLHSGFAAVGYMTSKKEIFMEAFALAVIIGTFLQLWLLPKISARFIAVRKAAKTKNKKVKAAKDEPEIIRKSTTWRTA
jgi:hypothetical protein